jgi:hypothetical protein
MAWAPVVDEDILKGQPIQLLANKSLAGNVPMIIVRKKQVVASYHESTYETFCMSSAVRSHTLYVLLQETLLVLLQSLHESLHACTPCSHIPAFGRFLTCTHSAHFLANFFESQLSHMQLCLLQELCEKIRFGEMSDEHNYTVPLYMHPQITAIIMMLYILM